MKLRIASRTEKARNAQVFIDDKCVGTLPIRVLPAHLMPELDTEADEELVSEVYSLLKSHARQMLLDYLAKAEHSEWQSRQLLMRHRFGPDIADELIEYAKKHRFIDDARYAQIYIRSWLNRGIGLRLLKSKLFEQHIDASIWQPILEELFDAGESRDQLTQTMRQYLMRQKELSRRKLKEKTFSHFVRKGFALDQINQAWQSVMEDDETE